MVLPARAQKRTNKIQAFLSDEDFEVFRAEARRRGEAPGMFARRILENVISTTLRPEEPAA